MYNEDNSNNTLKIALWAFLIICILSVSVFLLKDKIDTDFTLKTSDAENIKVKFQGNLDPWPGYIPIASNLLKNKLRAKGIDLQWTSDNGDTEKRINSLNIGEIDIAVITVDAHQLSKIKNDLVGVEVMVIDESHGGDSTIAWKECDISKISDLNIKGPYSDKNPDGWKMSYLENTPSHQQVRTIGRDFGITYFLKNQKPWFIQSENDRKVFEKFKNKEVCLVTTWEPWKSKLLKMDGTVELYSSKQADKDIVDLLVVNRTLLDESNPKYEYLETMLNEYFDTLHQLRDDRNQLLIEAKRYLKDYAGLADLQDDEIFSMIDGVKWINLKDNAELWFGLSGVKYFGIIEAHEAARNVIKEDESHNDHLKGFDFSKVINSNIIRKLYLMGGYSQESDNSTVTDSLKRIFTPLTNEQWNALQEVGVLKSKPIIFQSGDSSLDENSTEFLDEIMDELKRYPNFRIELTPGYYTSGDVNDEQKIAKSRANTVMQYLIANFDISENRIRIVVPSPENVSKVIPIHQNESTRSYGSRLRQVHFILKNSPR
ncbi:MAG: OmpA family protein [Candidatus Gracilibacteria bacterium]|nr:OmpA family protein [Candidatus Gracilibacteria bacterium]